MMVAKKSPSSVACGIRVISAAVAAMVATAAVHAEGASKSPSTPLGLLSDKSYYAIADLGEAAGRLLDDAKRYGIRTDIPAVAVASKSKTADRSRVYLELYGAFEADTTDGSFGAALVGKSNADSVTSVLAILVPRRPLTIEEVADLMFNGVRIYDRIRVGVGDQADKSGFVLAGKPRDLLSVANSPYCLWMREYTAEMKMVQVRPDPSQTHFVARTFYRIANPEYIDELIALGAQDIPEDYNAPTITFSLPFASIYKVAKLPWIRAVASVAQIEVEGSVYGAGHQSLVKTPSVPPN